MPMTIASFWMDAGAEVITTPLCRLWKSARHYKRTGPCASALPVMVPCEVMICMVCAEFRPGGKGSHCPDCGAALVADKRDNLERLFAARTRRLLSRWQEAGLVSPESAALL